MENLLKQALAERGLSLYGASQIIGTETDEALKAIHHRLSRWLAGKPPRWAIAERDLSYLGYKLTILLEPINKTPAVTSVPLCLPPGFTIK